MGDKHKVAGAATAPVVVKDESSISKQEHESSSPLQPVGKFLCINCSFYSKGHNASNRPISMHIEKNIIELILDN